MSPEEIVEKLTYLLDRDAIRDVVTSYCRGVDRFDRDLLLSTYHPDAMDDHAGFVGDREEFYDWVRDMHGTHHKLTQHYVANHLVEIDGDVAHAETYMIYAALNQEGQPFSLMGGRYIDRLEKRDGKWAIAERYMLGEWAAPAINSAEGALTPEGGPNRRNLKPYAFEVMKSQAKPARDKTDPSYLRPLTVPPSRRSDYVNIKRAAEATEDAG
jgi:ketosteroid isomerase-like protein